MARKMMMRIGSSEVRVSRVGVGVSGGWRFEVGQQVIRIRPLR